MSSSEPRAPRTVNVGPDTETKDEPRRAPRQPKQASGPAPGLFESTVDDTPAKRQKWAKDLKEELESNYQMIGTILGFAAKNQMQQGAAINFIENSGAAADAWVDVAEKNPKVKAALIKFTSGTAFAQVISVHFAMLTPVLAGYGLVPESAGMMILMSSMSDEQKMAMAAAAAAQNGAQ